MSDRFVDVGAGWFLSNGHSQWEMYLADACSDEPNRRYGPAAWDEQDGPCSGLQLLVVESPGLRHFANDPDHNDAPAVWPMLITVLDSPFSASLNHLHARLVSSEADLIELVKEVTFQLPEKPLPLVSAQVRRATGQFLFPHIFGAPSGPQNLQ